MDLTQGALLFARMAASYENAVYAALEEAAVIVETEAKSYPGAYQTGWAPLNPETIAHKATGDSPLLETGEMRDSIEHTVVGSGGHVTSAFVGSNNDKAVWQELGTSRGIPPRSFLGLAAAQKGGEAAKAIASKIMGALKSAGAGGYSYNHWEPAQMTTTARLIAKP